jgi:hypothetical protein
MSDSNLRPGASGGPDALNPINPQHSPQHPRGSGASYDPNRLYGDQRRDSDQGYMEQASEMADDAWRAGREYYDEGSRRVSEWADDHPNQLWAAIAVAGAFALWMAYRPVFSSRSRSNFDASRYRYRRMPRPSGRSAGMERGAVSADRTGRGI